MTTLGFNIKFVADNVPILPAWYFSAVTAFFFLSLGVNALVTALIVYKIITVYHDIRGFNASNLPSQASAPGRRDLYPLISILIESGLITFVGQLTQSIMYKSATVAFPLVGGVVVMLYVRVSCRLLISCRNFIYLLLTISQGISTTVVLVRVEMGISYDAASRTANSTNSGRPIQLTPFASMPKLTTSMDVPGSDDLGSEIKLIPNRYRGP